MKLPTDCQRLEQKCNGSIGETGAFQLQELLAGLLSVINMFAPESNIYSIQCK